MFGQKPGDDGRRDPGLGKFTRDIEARRDDRGLDRIEHVEARYHIAEAVPFIVCLQHPVFARTNTVVGELVRPPHLEPPVLAPFVIDLAHGAAEIERFRNRFLDQRVSTRRFHHRRGHVAGSDDRVLRRRRGVHQIGFVERGFIEFAILGLLHDDLRCLRDTGQQFVR